MSRFRHIVAALLLVVGFFLALQPSAHADSHHFSRKLGRATQQRDEIDLSAPDRPDGQIAQDRQQSMLQEDFENATRTASALFGLSMGFIVAFLGIGLLCSAFWLWMFIDCLVNETGPNNEKLVWGLVIWFTSFIGAVIYYFVRRKERLRR